MTLAALKRDLKTVPDANLLVEIANLDLDDLERAVSVRLDMLSAQADLAEMPNLRHDDPERLAIAATHLRGSGPAEFGNRTPDDAYSSSTYEIVLLNELIRALEGILPALDALGLGPNIPSSWLAAAATVIDILAVTPNRARRWLLQIQQVEERDVANAQARLKSLLEADTEWSSRLSGYKHREPSHFTKIWEGRCHSPKEKGRQAHRQARRSLARSNRPLREARRRPHTA